MITVPYSESNKKEQIPFIVWIRTISVGLILLCHLAITSSNPYIVMSSQLFNVGVNIFIIISGFLFGYLGVKRPYRKWLLKRMKRIYCPYWVFLAVITMIHMVQRCKITLSSFIRSVLGIHGFTYVFSGFQHTWFISAILLCYLMTPLIDMFVSWLLSPRNERKFWPFICVIICMPVGIAFLREYAILGTIPFYALAFILGRKWENINIQKKEATIAASGVIISFALRFFVRILIDDSILYTNIVAVYTHYFAAFCFLFAASFFFRLKTSQNDKK